jgi:hypothetical protein
LKKLVKDKTALATMAIVAIVIIIVAVVGVAAYVLLTQNAGTPEETPTPTPTVGIADATSLQFTVSITHSDGGDPESYTYYAKNIGSDDVAIRIDMDLGSSGKFSYIIDSGAQKSWMTMDEGATWIEGVYSDDQGIYAVQLKDYMDTLIAAGGTADYTYTSGDATIVISGIEVDPTLADSLFTAS